MLSIIDVLLVSGPQLAFPFITSSLNIRRKQVLLVIFVLFSRHCKKIKTAIRVKNKEHNTWGFPHESKTCCTGEIFDNLENGLHRQLHQLEVCFLHGESSLGNSPCLYSPYLYKMKWKCNVLRQTLKMVMDFPQYIIAVLCGKKLQRFQ